MKLKTFVFNQLQVNTYLLIDENTKRAIVIDPGCQNQAEKEAFAQYVQESGISLQKIINTHLHFDHIYGNRFVEETFRVGAYANKADVFFLNRFQDLLVMFGMPEDEEALPLTGYIADGDVIAVDRLELHALAVPGHSPGSLAYYMPKEKCVFVGDTILEGSIGRTDMHKGNFETLVNSIQTKLMTLPDDTIVYSGHGRQSTIGHERAHNPYLQIR